MKDLLNPVETRSASPGIKSTLKLDDSTQLYVSGTPITHVVSIWNASKLESHMKHDDMHKITYVF